MNTLQGLTKKANLHFMKQAGLKLLTLVLLFVHLVAPVQALFANPSDMSDMSPSHCMQQMDHKPMSNSHSGDCCQQTKVCDEASCNHCQSCAAVAMLVNLHRQTVLPVLTATSLVHVADYLQSIPAQNLYRPPITIL